MDRAVRSTHQPSVFDTIEFFPKFNCLKPELLRALYIEKGLSSSEIANQLGLSKSFILSKMKQFSIPMREKGATNPQDFRNPNPPYGYRIVDKKLQPYPKEISVCRLIVELIDRNDMSLASTAKELSSRKIKRRDGSTTWSPMLVHRIFKRWKGKL